MLRNELIIAIQKILDHANLRELDLIHRILKSMISE